MAHFAEIDSDNIVLRVLVVHDNDEHRGQEFLADDLGLGGTWIKTSYNTMGGGHYEGGDWSKPDGGTPFRYNFAAIGDTWDAVNEAFIRPQPHPSWALDEGFTWQPPTPWPREPITVEVDGVFYDTFVPYRWDEGTTSWVEVE